jgi:hypothetical protein
MSRTTLSLADAKLVEKLKTFADKLGGLCMAERMSDVRFIFHKGDKEKEVSCFDLDLNLNFPIM